MGTNLSKEEEVILLMWILIVKRKGLKVTGNNLQKMLLWGRQQGFEASSAVAFSVTKWRSLGEALFDAASKGEKDATDLLTVWRVLLETLKDLKAERDKERKKEDFDPVASTGAIEAPQETCESSNQEEGRVPLATQPKKNLHNMLLCWGRVLQGHMCYPLSS